MIEPTQEESKWTAPRKEGQPAAYVGLDAFSVPMQGPGAGKAEHRMLYTALLYTPEKEHTRYLVDFELDALAEQVRSQARAVGVARVSDLIAVTYRHKGWDIGSGPTEAGCKIIGERLKGSGMRWVEDGAATVAAMRALYISGGKLWDGFWTQPHRAAA